MTDPRRERRLLTTDPTRAHQGPQNYGPFDLPDHPEAWDRSAHLRRDAHILDVGRDPEGAQTFELTPPTTPGAPDPTHVRPQPRLRQEGEAATVGPTPLLSPVTSRSYEYGVVVLTQEAPRRPPTRTRVSAGSARGRPRCPVRRQWVGAARSARRRALAGAAGERGNSGGPQ
jgi:hypothetical protein